MTLQRNHEDVEVHIPEWTLGERLAKARKDVRLEQEYMAKEFAVSPSTISAWENDLSQPRHFMRVMAAWADKTKVPLGWLLGTDQPPRSRCSDDIDLRVLPGGLGKVETYRQGTLNHLVLM